MARSGSFSNNGHGALTNPVVTGPVHAPVDTPLIDAFHFGDLSTSHTTPDTTHVAPLEPQVVFAHFVSTHPLITAHQPAADHIGQFHDAHNLPWFGLGDWAL